MLDQNDLCYIFINRAQSIIINRSAFAKLKQKVFHKSKMVFGDNDHHLSGSASSPRIDRQNLFQAMYLHLTSSGKLVNHEQLFLLQELKELNPSISYDAHFFKEAILSPQLIQRQTSQMCQKCIIHRLQRQMEEQCTSSNVIRCGLSNYQKNLLAIFFKYNFEFSQILEIAEDFIGAEELSMLFKCRAEDILDLKHIYLAKRDRVDHYLTSKTDPALIEHVFALKVKFIVSESIRNDNSPDPQQVQVARKRIEAYQEQLKIKTYGSVGSIRFNLSQLSGQELNFYRLGRVQKAIIKRAMDNIATKHQSQEEALTELRFFAKENNLKYQNTLANYNKMKAKRSASVNEYQEILEQINYYKYKYYLQTVELTLKYIHLSPLMKKYVKDNCVEEFMDMAKVDHLNCLKIALKVIDCHMRGDRSVVFIDHTQFYQSEFHYYNKAFRGIQAEKVRQYEPKKDNILTVITGMTPGGILFHDICLKKNLQIWSYFQRLLLIFQQLGDERLPKIIVIYMTWSFRKDELKGWLKLTTLLQKKGRNLLLLPGYKHVPNPNRLISRYMKGEVLEQMSLSINNKDFQNDLATKLQIILSNLDQRNAVRMTFSQWRKSSSIINDASSVME